MANFVNKNQYPLDKDQGFGLKSTIQQKTLFCTATEEVNNSTENSPLQEQPKGLTQLQNESNQTRLINLNPKLNSKSLVNQVSLKQNYEIKMTQNSYLNVQSKVLEVDNLDHENSQVVISMSVNNENTQTSDWLEQTPPVQRQNDKFQQQYIDQVRIRKINTADPIQNANLRQNDIKGPVLLMPSKQKFSAVEQFSVLASKRPTTRNTHKQHLPQSQKSNRRQLITNGIFLPSENLVMIKGNTVANTIQIQKPVVSYSKRMSKETILDYNQQKLESQTLQPIKGVTLSNPGKIEKSLLDQNLSYAFEITSRPTTQAKNQRNNVLISKKSRTIESRCVTLRNPTLNQQFLVSDSIMRQRLAFSYNPNQLDVEVKDGADINQKIMDTSFGRLENTSPEMSKRVENRENKQTSLLAATLYERTGYQVSQNKKAQQYKQKRPFYQEASFDPSFSAYQDGGSKIKSASLALTEKAKRMEFEGSSQIQSEPINAKDKTLENRPAHIFQDAIDSRRASLGFEEEIKQTPDCLNRELSPQPNEVLLYGSTKVQTKQTYQAINSITTQKPSQQAQQSFYPQSTVQKAKAVSSRAGTSGNHKYAISDIQIQKPIGSSEALNQQLLQQQAYFQHQRALINQITHQNSKVLKEKAQDESQKPKQPTLRNKSSGTKKTVFTMAETQSKFNTALQQAQEHQANKFLGNRQPSFAKTIKQEPQSMKNKNHLHVETKLDRTPQKDCLTADSVLQKKPLIQVIPKTIQTQTRHTIVNERNNLKTLGLKDQELKAQEITKVKEYIYADPVVNIGKGKYGPVDLIIVGGSLRALKRIRKDSITNQKRIDHVKAEKKILNFLHQEGDRDFIVKLYDTFTDNEYICFVFEYLAGQDLFWVLQNEHNLALGKQEAGGRRVWVTFYCAEILVALSTLHLNNIVYRDLKPDNIMIDNQGHVKLIDFGFSKQLGQNSEARTYTNCGTLGYTAPEVIAGQGYTYSADLWSFGIVIAELLSGSLPFEEKNDPMGIQQAILQGDVKYQREGVDNTARDLLSQIFVTEPNLRIPLERIKQHKFFLGQQMQGDQNLTASAYWKQVQQKKFGQVPYKPNPMKYQYLLQNTYERISNLQGQLTNQQYSPEEDPSPNSRGINRGNSPLKKSNMLGNFTIYRVNKEFENF